MTLFSYLSKVKALRGSLNVEKVQHYILNFRDTYINNGVFGDTIFVKELNHEFFVFITNSKNKSSYYACLVSEINISALKFEFLNFKDFELHEHAINVKEDYLYVGFKERGVDESLMPAPVEKVFRFNLKRLKTVLNYYEGWEYFEETVEKD